MGHSPKHAPKYLGAKLRAIREYLCIESYDAMIARLNLPDIPLTRSHIHRYEKGQRIPSLLELLRYSQLSGISVNDLIDDEVKLSTIFETAN